MIDVNRGRKEGILFLILAIIFILGFFSINLDNPIGLTIYEFVNENATEINATIELTQNQTLVNETLIKENYTIIENQTNITEFIENITEINFTLINKTNITLENIIKTNITEINITNITEIPVNITQINLTNITLINITTLNETNLTILEEKPLHKVVIKQPVRWAKKILPNESITITEIPLEAKDIIVKKTLKGKESKVDENNVIIESNINSITGAFIFNFFREASITGLAIYDFVNGESNSSQIPSLEEIETKEITINEEADELIIEYTLPGPEAIEETTNSGKKITIYSELNYTDILAFMNIKEAPKDRIELYHVEETQKELINATLIDTNNNNLIDYIEWIVPHLSNQTYEVIIEISKAEHLDKNREFIEDIYSEVSARDDVWKEVSANNYIRVTFEKLLNSNNDITIYARSELGGRVEVYERNSDIKLADFGTILDDDKYKIYLTSLTETQDTFDLKIIGNPIEFDYIVDPAITVFNDTFDENTDTPLENHIPTPIGTGWTRDACSGSCVTATVRSSGDYIEFSADNNDYSIYTVDDVPSSSEYNISVTIRARDTLDDVALILGRWIDVDNTYVISLSGTASECHLRAISEGSVTLLDTPDTGVAVNDVILFEITDSVKNVYKNGILWMSSNDNTITSIGKGGIGCGDLGGDGGEDCRADWDIDDFTIREFGSDDSNSPEINLISPLNNTLDQNGFVIFEYNVTDNSAISSCSLIINGSINQTNYLVTKNIIEKFNSSLISGKYETNINCTDSKNNIGVSDNLILQVDRIWNQVVDVNTTIKDANGTIINSTIEFIDPGSNKTDFNASGGQVEVHGGKYNIRVNLDNSPVNEIIFNEVNITGDVENIVKIDDTPETNGYIEVYAIDPTNLNFTNAIVTVNATGFKLYKCTNWNFTGQNCNGNWELFKSDLNPGQEYNFILTANDPGFGEYNFTEAGNIHKAYASANAGALPPGSGPTIPNEVEFSSAQYSQINESDNLRVETTSSSGNYRVHRFLFNISESIALISQINLTWEGYSSGNPSQRYVSLYIWNFTSGSWGSYVSRDNPSGDNEFKFTINSGFNDYVNDSGSLIFLAEGDNTNALTLYSDFAKIGVLYDNEDPSATLVSPTDNEVVSTDNINFICNTSDDSGLENVTFYWNYSGSWISNESKDIGGTNNQSTFSKISLDNVAILWGCYVCDTAGSCAFSNSNYTVIVNSSISIIFFDDFESGSLATRGWDLSSTSGSNENWTIGTNPSEGTYNAEVFYPGSGEEAYLEISMSTAGYENINITYYKQMVGLDSVDNYSVHWFDGTNWNTLEDTYGDDASYVYRGFTPTGADNNSNFKLRFTCESNAVSEGCRVDYVTVTGTEIPITAPITINSVSDSPDPVALGNDVKITAEVVSTTNVSSIWVDINGTNYTMIQQSAEINVTKNVFYEGFESGSLNTKGWNLTGESHWAVDSEESFNGSYHTKVFYTGSGKYSYMEVNIDTSDYSNITFTYYRQLLGLDSVDDFSAEWFDGTDWNYVEHLDTGSENDDDYIYKIFNLSSDADNNSAFRIRFACEANAFTEGCKLDDVRIGGIVISGSSNDWAYSYKPNVVGNYSYTIYANDTSSNNATSKSGSFNVYEANITINEVVRNETGDMLNVTLEIEDENNVLIYNETKKTHHKKLVKGKYKVKIKPKYHVIKEIEFVDLNLTKDISGFVDVDEPSSKKDFGRVYGIRTEYDKSFNATVKINISKGKALFKCANWNFTNKTCQDGLWEKIKNIIKSQEYNFTETLIESIGFAEDNETLVITGYNNYLVDSNQSILANNSGILDVRIVLSDDLFDNIKIYGYDESSNNYSLKITDTSGAGERMMGFIGNSEVYSIDPTEISHINITIKIKNSTGNDLYKCSNWNFAAQTCNGNWTLFKTDLVARQSYSFNISGEDPGFAEIDIIKAEHLNETRGYIENIYSEVKSKDYIFKEIPADHYARAVFRKDLTLNNDITIYARSNNSGSVEVYEKDQDTKLADFGTISNYGKYRILLTNLIGSQDTFDLKVIGNSVEFDQIKDPPEDGFTLIFNDTFTDTSGIALQTHPPDLGSSWIEIWEDNADLTVDVSNDLGCSGGLNDGAAAYINISTTIQADQIAVINYSTDDAGDDVLGLLVRADSTWANAYAFTWDQDGGSETKLWKRNNSVNYDLNTTGCQSRSYVEKSVIKLKVTGTNPAVIEVYDDDVFVCGYTDSISPITSGRPGAHSGSHPNCLDVCDDSSQNGDDFLAYHIELDTSAPSFTNSINDTNINRHQNITMNITISDGIDIDNYTFSWNDTGSWVNTTFQLSGTLTSWSANTSKNITANEGVMVSWKYYACDSSNNCNVSATENFTVATQYPKFSNPVNDTGIEQNQNITMNITIIDDTALSSYIFSWNDTGSWSNDTAIIVTGQTNINANVSKNITASENTVVSWRYYANDTSNNWADSGLYNFTVKDINPPDLTINSPTGTIADVTPKLNITTDETSDRLWYNIDNGTNYTLCTSCTGTNTKFLHLAEGSYIVYAYANDSNGNLNNTESSSITIAMNGKYGDTFNDYSSINTNSSITWNLGNVSFTGTVSTYGDGSDGAKTISTADDIINNYTYLQVNVSASSTTLNVSNASEFSATDEILIVQMQNYSGGFAGDYEFATISSISGTIITLTSGLTNAYYSGVYNKTNSTVTQIVKVPQYTTLSVNSGASITAKDWNGTHGGIVVLKATTFVNVSGGINVTGKGFEKGDGIKDPSYNAFGYPGESFTGKGSTTSNNSNKGGGGGGYNDIVEGGQGVCGASGGGGGYGTNGTGGDTSDEGQAGGDGGGNYSNASIGRLLPGSGGGGGGTDNNGSTGGEDGGDGGGIIYIISNKIVITGNITAKGNKGINGVSWAGAGGGGSGGTIWLSSSNLTLGTNLVNASGGVGGTQGQGNDGGDGGYGRIRLDFTTLTGTTIPPSGFNGTEPTASGAGLGNFTSYSINTTSNIQLITNITWNESGTDATNNISVEVSVNNGLNWYTATKNQELSGFTANNTLIYRTLFTTDSATTIYLLDMNISWGEAAPTFSNPANGTGIEQNQNITMNMTITDDTGLDNYTFSWNDSGSWSNVSSVDLGGSITTVNANTSRKISSAANTVISWRYYACDNSSNCGASGVYNFTVSAADTSAPSFSNAANDTKINRHQNITMNITISDGTDIANYTFSWNDSGSWINKTSQLSGTQLSWAANISKNITANEGSMVSWKYYACDSGNYCNTSATYNFTVLSENPKFESAKNNTGMTLNDLASMNITIKDDTALSGYIFSWNDTSSWVNETAIIVTGQTTVTANKSKTITANEGEIISWRYYANDTSGNQNESGLYNITIFSENPLFSNAANDTGVEQNQNITMNMTITDNVNLSSYIFSWSDTGSWSNDTAIIVTGQTNINANVSKKISASPTTVISWRYYANDSSGNWNESGLYNFTVAPAPNITIDSPRNNTDYTTKNLTLQVTITNDNVEPDSVWYTLDNGTTNTTITLNRTGHEWRTHGRAMFTREGYVESYGPRVNTTLWKANVTGTYDQYGSPAVANGIVYYHAKDDTDTGSGYPLTFAINSTTGNILWNFSSGEGDEHVTVKDGYIYTVERSNDPSENITKAYANNGTIIWQTDYGIDMVGGVVVANDKVYTNTQRSGWCQIAVFNDTNGSLIEEFNQSGCDYAVGSPPARWDKKIYAAYSGGGSGTSNLFALNESNVSHIIWESDYCTNGYWDTSPMIDQTTGILYIGGKNGNIHAFNSSNGSIIWTFENQVADTRGVLTKPAYWNDIVCGGGLAGNFTCVNATNGNLIWYNETGGFRIYSSPAISTDGIIYYAEAFGSTAYRMWARNITDGDLIWEFGIPDLGDYGLFSSPAVVDGILYVASDRWYLYAIGDEHHYRYKINFTASIGSNKLIIYANNSAGAISSETITFTTPSVGYISQLAPANGSSIDRDAINASASDNQRLVVKLSNESNNVNLTFYANLTDPSLSGQSNIYLGSNTTNSSGIAVFGWNGTNYTNEKMYAGNYTWWANTTGYIQNSTRFIYVYMGLNFGYRYTSRDPNSTYNVGDTVILDEMLHSLGPETDSQINNSYKAKVNVTLTDPNENNFSVELLDPDITTSNNNFIESNLIETKTFNENSDITILNKQSYPIKGGNWEVKFKTKGTADLIITPTDKTNWNDLKFLKVMCGNKVLAYELIDNSIVIRDYNCDETGKEISKVISSGKHTLMFKFGEDIEYAHNQARALDINFTTFFDYYKGGEVVDIIVRALLYDNASWDASDTWRWYGINDTYHLDYKVFYPNGSTYEEATIEVDNTTEHYTGWYYFNFTLPDYPTKGVWKIGINASINKYEFDIATNQTNITFDVPNTYTTDTLPFHRQAIIDAGQAMLLIQNSDGSWTGADYSAYEVNSAYGTRACLHAWKITGNSSFLTCTERGMAYLNGAGITGMDAAIASQTFGEFALWTGNHTYDGEADKVCNAACAWGQTTDADPFESAEAAYGCYRTYQGTGNITNRNNYSLLIKDNVTDDSSWDDAYDSWYYVRGSSSGRNQMPRNFLPPYGLYFNKTDSIYLNKSKNASKFGFQYFALPNFASLSYQTTGTETSGNYEHYTAEMGNTVVFIYEYTGDDRWKSISRPVADYLERRQLSSGRFNDDNHPSDWAWNTMWAVWFLDFVPSDVYVSRLSDKDNTTIKDAKWDHWNKLINATVSGPSTQQGFLIFRVPNGTVESNITVEFDGVNASANSWALNSTFELNDRSVVVNFTFPITNVVVYYGNKDEISPTIEDYQFNTTSAIAGDAVRFNVTIKDAKPGISTVITTFRFPNGTQLNKTAYLHYDSNSENLSDLEDKVKQIKAVGNPGATGLNISILARDAADSSAVRMTNLLQDAGHTVIVYDDSQVDGEGSPDYDLSGYDLIFGVRMDGAGGGANQIALASKVRHNVDDHGVPFVGGVEGGIGTSAMHTTTPIVYMNLTDTIFVTQQLININVTNNTHFLTDHLSLGSVNIYGAANYQAGYEPNTVVGTPLARLTETNYYRYYYSVVAIDKDTEDRNGNPIGSRMALLSFIYRDSSADGNTTILKAINWTYAGLASNETNTTGMIYKDIVQTHYENITNITVKVEIDSYNPNASDVQSTHYPDLYLDMWNGTSWIGIGEFDLNETYGDGQLNTTNANFTVSTSNSNILARWGVLSYSNRDIRLRGFYMDYYNKSIIDEINYTDVWVTVDYESSNDVYYHDWTSTTNTGRYNVTVLANDTAGNVNVTNTTAYFDVTQATPAPIFSNPANATGIAQNQNITMNMTITDDTGLDNYTFSWNDTGSWSNVSSVDLGGSITTVNANVSRQISAAVNTVVSWRYYACDNSSNCGDSGIYNFTVATADTFAPSFSNSNNDTNLNRHQNITMNITIDDDTDINNYTFSWNNSGSFVNTTFQLSGTLTTWSANISKNITANESVMVSWKYYACDSKNQCNTSATENFTVATKNPIFSNPVNDTNIKRYNNITMNITIIDDTDLANYTFSWNDSGSWSNNTFQLAGTQLRWNANISKNISANEGVMVSWKYYACDSRNQCNTSATENFTVASTNPVFSNAVNDSGITQYNNITMNITITDDTELASYTFSWNDGGSWSNDTAIKIPGQTTVNANVSKNITSSENSVVYWRYYANDSSGNKVDSGLYSFTVSAVLKHWNGTFSTTSKTAGVWTLNSTAWVNWAYTITINESRNFTLSSVGDTDAPTFSNSKNNTGVKRHNNASMNITISDSTDIANFTFSWNDTGSWSNNTPIQLAGTQTSWSFNLTKNITNAVYNQVVQWRVYACDSGNYCGVSATENMTVVNTVPTHSTPILNSSSGTNLSTENLTVYNQSTSDLDNNKISNYFRWFRNGILFSKDIDAEDSANATGVFSASYPATNAYDEDWDTYAVDEAFGADARVYENFSNPSRLNYANVTWKAESYANLSCYDYNISDWRVINNTGVISGKGASYLTQTIPVHRNCFSGTNLLQLQINLTSQTKYYESNVTWIFAGNYTGSSTSLNSSYISGGYNWSNCITPFDGMGNGTTLCSTNLTIVDDNNPTFSNSINNTGVKIYFNASMNITISDVTDIANYTFSWNNSGTWVNDTTVQLAGTQTSWAFNLTKNITNAVYNQVVQWRVYACDSGNYCGVSATENMTVANTAPPTPTNLAPADNSTITNRTPLFVWNNQTEVDNQSVTWNLYYDDNSDFTSPSSKIGITTNNSFPTDQLDTDTTYYWRVSTYDGVDYSSNSSVFNLTIESSITISVINATVNFTNLTINDVEDTTDQVPDPLVVQNDGNVYVDVNLTTNKSLWNSVGLGTSYFQAKTTNNTAEYGSFNFTNSTTSFFNIPNSNYTVISQLNFNDTKDSAIIDIKIQVPPNEPVGARYSGIIFFAQSTI